MLHSLRLLKRLFFLNIWVSFVVMSLNFVDWNPMELIDAVYMPLAVLTQAFLLNLLAAIFSLIFLYFGIRVMAVPFVFVQLMLLVDYFIFGIYRFHIDFFFIKMFFQDFEGMGASLLVVSLIILTFFVFAVGFSWLGIMFARSRMVRHAGKLIIAIFVVSFLGQSIHAWGYAHNYRAILTVSPYIPWYAPLIATDEVKEWGLYNEDLKQDQLNLDVSTSGNFNYPKEQYVCSADKPMNVVFIVLESWRYDRMTPEVSPNIFQIGQDSMSFSNHLSGGNVTTNGMYSLFFGTTSSFKQKTESNATLPNLISSVKALDYDIHILANQDIVRNNLSIQLFGDVVPLQSRYQGGNGVGDAKVVDGFAQVASADKPFFSLLFFNDTHFPYKSADTFDHPFQPAKRLDLSKVSDDTDPLPYFNQYSNAIYYLDHLVGKVKTDLIEKGIWDNTILVITGDHGEEFNDKWSGFWGHGSKFDRYQIGVPLVMHWPGKQGQNDYRTHHEDVASTVLIEGLGCETDYDNIGTGLNLFENSERKMIAESYVNRAFIQDDTVYEIYPGYVETYDLDGDAEIEEHDNVLNGFLKIQTWFN